MVVKKSTIKSVPSGINKNNSVSKKSNSSSSKSAAKKTVSIAVPEKTKVSSKASPVPTTATKKVVVPPQKKAKKVDEDIDIELSDDEDVASPSKASKSTKVSAKRCKATVPSYDISFLLYIYKVLKQVHPDTGLNSQSIHTMNRLINILGTAIAEVASHVRLQASQKKNCDFSSSSSTLMTKHIEFAIRTLFPGALSDHAIAEGIKAVGKYSTSNSTKAPSKKGAKTSKPTPKSSVKITKAQRAGLQFSPPRAREFFNVRNDRITGTCSVYLAAVLEYMAAEILELAGNASRDGKRVRITNRHIFQVISSDEELYELFYKRLHVIIENSGVTPSIHASFLTKNKNKSSARRPKGSPPLPKGPHRFRPGTRALMNIRDQQKQTDMIFARLPFFRFIKNIVKSIFSENESLKDKNVNYSKTAKTVIQSTIESLTLDRVKNAIHMMTVSERVTLDTRDFGTVGGVTLLRDDINKEELIKPSIKRILYRAGIKRSSDAVYATIRDIIIDISVEVLRPALMFLVVHDKTILTSDHIIPTLSYGNIKVNYAGKYEKV